MPPLRRVVASTQGDHAGGPAKPVPRRVLVKALPVLPLLFLAVVLVAPVLRLLAEGLAPGAANAEPLRWLDVWQDEFLRWRVLWSFAQAAITCVLALLLGLPCAWVLARRSSPAARWCCAC
jgi:thiamine transport system permease protein